MRTLFHRSIFLLCAAAASGPSLMEAVPSALSYDIQDKEEAFLIRRIAEFWKDQDYAIVKKQISDFIAKYPNSSINDHLRGILGDLHLQESNYVEALAEYAGVKSVEIQEKVALNKMQCHYELNEFEELLVTGSPYLEKLPREMQPRREEYQFLMGEGYFRSALTMDKGEVQVSYLERARPLYEEVLHTSFSDPSMFALAEIYRLKEENEKASKFFTELASRHPERKEELLFHAGLAQAEYDKASAIDTFSMLIKEGGSKASDATLNRLILFFQEDRFDEVIDHYQEVSSNIEEDQSGTLNYIIGRSYFSKEEYQKAANFLEKYIAVNQGNSPELRNTLLMQLNCAQNLKDESLYETTVSALEKKFPEDSELPQAIFIHAMMLKEMGQTEQAEEKLDALIETNAHFENDEVLFLEHGLVSFSNENWAKSHMALASYLQSYPESEHAAVAWKYFLSTSLNLLKTNENGAESGYSKQDFLEDLTKVLGKKEVLSSSEERQCRFLLGKISYELQKYEQSLSYLQDYLDAYPEDTSSAEANLMVALCHYKLSSPAEEFCKYAEMALSQDSELTDKAAIHLELYNVYLTMIEKEGENSDLYSKAAEHLYTAMSLQELPVKLENKLWLANHYYESLFSLPQVYEVDGPTVTGDKLETLDRCQALLQNILTDSTQIALVTIDKDHLYMEWEALKFANLLGRGKKYDHKITVLKNLIEQQTKNVSWDWKLRKEAMLELAKSYEMHGRRDDALDTLSFIAGPDREKSSFVAEYANMHALRISFDLLSEEEKTEENPKVQNILNDLKEIQIRKGAPSEPLHIESALEYAWIRAQISESSEAPMKYLFFLNRIKEDFNNVDDPMIVNYHAELKEDGAKKHIYETYMKFVDAEILRTEAILASKEQKLSESVSMADRSNEILYHLESEQNLYYLQRRVELSKDALTRSKVY